jgi:hypothetical protein
LKSYTGKSDNRSFIPMKPNKNLRYNHCVFLAIIFFIIISEQSFSQCIPSTWKSISYSTMLKGTGNNSWGFLFPQFNPTQGTLVAVNIKATVSLNYNFGLENNANTSVGYNVSVKRRDSISSNDMSLPLISTVAQNYGPYNLLSSDGKVGSGPDYTQQGPIVVMNNYVINDSITSAVAAFIGGSHVIFYYNPVTTAAVSGNNSYSFNSTAADTIHFLLTYYYCNTIVLQNTITDFFAAKQNSETIKLSWTTQNELRGRTYEIEKSANGKDFVYTATVDANIDSLDVGNYLHYYQVTTGDNNEIYFRLKMIDADGSISYSEIRAVDLGGNVLRFSLYPNPASQFININFGQSGRSWDVKIFASHGGVVLENYWANTSLAHIVFKNNLAKGAYFVRITEQQSQKSYMTSFIID